MTLPAISVDATAQELVDGLNAYLDAAEKHFAERDLVELAGLDSVVEALCRRIEKMPVDEGRHYATPLNALNARLDTLQQSMAQLQAEMRDEINTLTARAKASRAYTKETK